MYLESCEFCVSGARKTSEFNVIDCVAEGLGQAYQETEQSGYTNAEAIGSSKQQFCGISTQSSPQQRPQQRGYLSRSVEARSNSPPADTTFTASTVDCSLQRHSAGTHDTLHTAQHSAGTHSLTHWLYSQSLQVKPLI